MSIKGLFAACCARKNTDSRNSINIELDRRQRVLENDGFKVKRSEQLVNYEAALSLTAEKDNVVFRATRFLRGGRDLSVTLKHGGQETTLPIYPYKFDDAIAIVTAAQDRGR
ncbi:MAG: hypothetical protein P4N59_04175 [Negativicutes bacterium]|nr:hypothetical protein [Negativicutes bacterium]